MAAADDLRIVSLDMDDTLIRPAIFNAVAEELGFAEPLRESFRRYSAGEITIPEAFEQDYRHFVGRRVTDLDAALAKSPAWVPGIREAVDRFHDAGLRVIVTTDQPRFLVAHAQRRFGVDDLVCTEATLDANGCVTADCEPHFEKWPHLARHLDAWGVPPEAVAHVGNGTNDIPVFEHVGASVAVNYENEAVARAATHAIRDLHDFNQVADVLLA